MELLSSIFGFLLATAKLFIKIWWAWVWFFPLAAFGLWLKSPKGKGKTGEMSVSKILRTLPKNKYILLNDILIEAGSGTAQIDHILVSVYGIFVIETKTYQGLIYGDTDSNYWTQNIYGSKKTFMNPVLQNYGHIKALRNILTEYGHFPVYSVIAFSDEANLKGVSVSSGKSAVVNRRNLINVIKSASNDEKLTCDEIKEIAAAIKLQNITDKKARQQHNSEAGSKKQAGEIRLQSGECPRCGGKLVIRHGKNVCFG